MKSPLGPLTLVASDEALLAVHLEPPAALPGPMRATPLLKRAAQQLAEYFAGEREAFDLPLAPSGTDFQRAVWRELRQIPFGQTVSYGEVAKRLGRPSAVRAVGAANGSNPIALVIPCHRVIGSTGDLVGYGGGLSRKKWLLAHESRQRTLPM